MHVQHPPPPLPIYSFHHQPRLEGAAVRRNYAVTRRMPIRLCKRLNLQREMFWNSLNHQPGMLNRLLDLREYSMYTAPSAGRVLVSRYEFVRDGLESVEYDPEFQLIRPLNFYVRAKRR